jgi:hypothetical protein
MAVRIPMGRIEIHKGREPGSGTAVDISTATIPLPKICFLIE